MTSLDTEDNYSRPWYSGRSLQDLIAIYLLRIAVVSTTTAGICYVYEPSMRLLLYAAVPVDYQNWLSFGLCFIVEIQYLAILVVTEASTWQLQVISFDLITHKLGGILEHMKADA